MFQLRWTAEARSNYDNLRAKAKANRSKKRGKQPSKSTSDEGLFKQVHKTLQYLQANPRHPGLHTHEYHSLPHPWDKHAKVFEAYAQNKTPGAYRIFWCYGPGQQEITILAITPHP